MMKQSLVPALGASLFALVGCVSVLPEPEAPEALYAIEASTAYDGLSADLIIREPEAPRLVGGQGIVSEGGDGGLRLVRGVEWSGSATRQIQLAMVDSFKAGDAGNALLPEYGVLAGYELASQVKRLRLEGDVAVCEMAVSLIESEDRQLVQLTEVSNQEQAVSGSARDRALALRRAASDCAGDAAQFAIEALAALDQATETPTD